MKVLFISHLYPNAAHPFLGSFVKEQAGYVNRSADLDVIAPVPDFPFISIFGKYKDNRIVPESVDFDNMQVFHPRYLVIPKFFKFLDAELYYRSLNVFFESHPKVRQADIMHFHWGYPDALAGIRWAKRFNKRTVLTVHGNESICFFESSLRKNMMLKHLKEIDHIIAVSGDLRDKIIGNYGVLPENISVIANGIDKEKFFLTDKQAAKKYCGFDSGFKYILSVCRLSEEKGLKYLFKALSMLDDKIRLVIAGDGPLKRKLVVLAKDLNISERIIFLGPVDHEKLRFWYNGADLFCLPSLWEGCPCTVIEAMACGAPVVATRVGAVPDLIDQKCGVLVDSKSPEQLKDSINRVLEKEWDNKAISKIGQDYTWEHVSEKISKIYEKVLK